MTVDPFDVIRAEFPVVDASNLAVTSEPSGAYNCFAYAFGVESAFWSPDPFGGAVLPDGFPGDCSLASFDRWMQEMGFIEAGPSNRVGKEGTSTGQWIALWACDGFVSHLAASGDGVSWRSKLGSMWDVEHGLGALDSPRYGAVVRVYKRDLDDLQDED